MILLFALLATTALAAEPGVGVPEERPPPDERQRAQMIAQAERESGEGAHRRVLAQVREAGCAGDLDCAPLVNRTWRAMLEAEAPASADELVGLASEVARWAPDEETRARVDALYAERSASLDPADDAALLDRLALEVADAHPLRERLRAWYLEPRASLGPELPGSRALLALAAAEYGARLEPSDLELPYPTGVEASVTATDCAADFPAKAGSGGLSGAVAVRVDRCLLTTDTWDTSERYEYEVTEMVAVMEEVVVGYDEECRDRPYYDDNGIQKEGWTETVCEQIPITEVREVMRPHTYVTTGVRTVYHRRYRYEVQGVAQGSLEDGIGSVRASQPLSVVVSEEDSHYDAEGGTKAWDAAKSEAAARVRGVAELRTAVDATVTALRGAYGARLRELAAEASAPEAGELQVRAWRISGEMAPEAGRLATAAAVVALPDVLEDPAWALVLPEARLIVDGYGRLWDTKKGSGWQIKAPGLLRSTSSGATVGFTLGRSYLESGWTSTLGMAVRAGGTDEYASENTFAIDAHVDLHTQTAGVLPAPSDLVPNGFAIGFTTRGGTADPDTKGGWALGFGMEYESLNDRAGGKGYRNASFVFPDLVLIVPGTRWSVGAVAQVKWNWLGLQDLKKREAGVEIKNHHYTPMMFGAAFALGPVQLRGTMTWLGFTSQELRPGATLDLVF